MKINRKFKKGKAGYRTSDSSQSQGDRFPPEDFMNNPYLLSQEITEENDSAICVLHMNDGKDVTATIRMETPKTWNISAWYNHTINTHAGWGKACLKTLVKHLLEQHGLPDAISYTWNGQNDYVGELVTEKWQGVCQTPLAILKKDGSDRWDSHIYDLNTSAFLEWAGLCMELKRRYPNYPYPEREYICRLTKILDKDLPKSVTERFRHYILADEICINQKWLAIRVPGRTVGGIKINDNNRIEKTVLYTNEKMFGLPHSKKVIKEIEQISQETWLIIPKLKKE